MSLVLIGCSRQPSAEAAYASSWKALRQGRLKEAQNTADLALKNYRGNQSANVFLQLRLLKAESLLAQSQAREARVLLDQLRDPADEMVLETAVNGQADRIATFNVKHLREAAGFFGISAARPGEIWEELRRKEHEKK